MVLVTKADHMPDALMRIKKTQPLDGHTIDQRFAALDQAIIVDAKRAAQIKGRRVVIVDDVMTTGSTFAASAQALLDAGADDVCVLALARVAKDA